MRAVRFDSYGPFDVLRLVDIERPEPSGDQVLVQMRAAAVNPFDNTCRMGWVPQVQPGMIQGNEGVGTFGFARDGTWQEYLTATTEEAIPTPENLSDAEAAATPVAYLAAQLALSRGVQLEKGMSILIPGVGGSVGNAAIQLAKVHGAGRVITSAGRTDKTELARALGYDDVVDLSQESLSAGVMRLTDGKGVDVALDSVGGPIAGEALKSVGPGGRVYQMGYPAGTDLAGVNAMALIWGLGSGSTSLHGFNMYFQPPEAWREAWSTLLPLLADGTLKPQVDSTYPLEQASEATRHLIEDRPFGKVILTM